MWKILVEGTANRYPLITLLQVGIHGLGIYLLSYRDFYILSCRPVGVIQMVIVVLASYLPQYQAPGVLAIVSLALLGTYRADQQTTPERGPQEAGSSTRTCNAPSATPAAMPHPLQRAIERCSPPASNGCKVGTRLPWDLPLGTRENELCCYVTVY